MGNKTWYIGFKIQYLPVLLNKLLLILAVDYNGASSVLIYLLMLAKSSFWLHCSMQSLMIDIKSFWITVNNSWLMVNRVELHFFSHKTFCAYNDNLWLSLSLKLLHSNFVRKYVFVSKLFFHSNYVDCLYFTLYHWLEICTYTESFLCFWGEPSSIFISL